MCLAETLDHKHTHDQNDGHDHVRSGRGRVGRRRFLLGGGAAAAGVALTGASSLPAAAHGGHGHRRRGRVVDLTHRLVRDFPTFTHDQPRDETVADYAADGFYAKRWTLNEHTGTHIDTPGHFSEGMRLVDQLEADELLAPIVVIDIRRRALDDPNAMVEPDDLVRFERRHGRIPHGALVCMDSGWAAKAGDPLAFLGGPAFPDYNFPGFSIEATDWLVARRNPVGIGVDTVSLDPGNSTSFDVHVGFLGSDHYGVEGLTNLDGIPPRGAHAFVGPIPWEDGSGSPCRVVASW
ncbi:MAG: cyclase family protein [Acidimicrobiales bacterium]